MTGSRQGVVRLSAQGVHWFDRETGLNVLLDEVVVPPEQRHRAPRYVSIALTNACELKCPYCYAPKHPARLGEDSVVGWAHELADAGCLGIGFGGGEPTAHPAFVAICQRIAASTQLAVTFTTHGHRLDARTVSMLLGAVHFVRVSVDGVDATYERLRGRSFSSLLERLRLARELAPFGINVVVNDQTVGELDAVLELAVSTGAEELLLLPEQPVGSNQGISRWAEGQLDEWINRRHKPIRLAISVGGATNAMPLADPFRAEQPLEGHAHVDASGVLRSDAYDPEGVRIKGSIIDALSALRAERET